MPLKHQASLPHMSGQRHDDAFDYANTARKRSRFNLFSGPRNADELEKVGSNDLKRYMFERRSTAKTPPPPATLAPPSAFHSPRLSVVGRPSSKATSVLGIGIEAPEETQRSWWRGRKSSRSSSRSSITSSIRSTHSLVETRSNPIHYDPPPSTSASNASTLRARSRPPTVSSRPSTRHHVDTQNPPPISAPMNFMHITHTGPEHFSRIHGATQEELAAELSAARASQTPRRSVFGIKVSKLSTRSSVDEPTPSLTTGSTRSSYYASQKSPGLQDPHFHHRSLRSKGSFSMPFREGELPSPRRVSSRASLSSRHTAVQTPVEDLPPLPPSNFTSQRVSMSLDESERPSFSVDSVDENQWCHAVTCDEEAANARQAKPYVPPPNYPAASPVPSKFARISGLAPPVEHTHRARSPARSDRSSRSSHSLPPLPPPPVRQSVVAHPKSALKHQVPSPKVEPQTPLKVKRSSINGGLFSSWHADSDSDDDVIVEPLQSIAEDAGPDAEDEITPTLPVQQEVESSDAAQEQLQPVADVVTTPAPVEIRVSEASEKPVEVHIHEPDAGAVEVKVSEPTDDRIDVEISEPSTDIISEVEVVDEDVTMLDHSTEDEQDEAMEDESPAAVVDEVEIATGDDWKIVTSQNEGRVVRRDSATSERRVSVIVGEFEAKTAKTATEETKPARKAPSRKNSGKTVRFKEDLVSFIREEVARRNEPSPEESAGQVQASLEDLEATLARLEAEIDSQQQQLSPRAETHERDSRTPTPTRAHRQENLRSGKHSGARSKPRRPFSESYDKPITSRTRIRNTDPLPKAMHGFPRQMASYDDMMMLERTSSADSTF